MSAAKRIDGMLTAAENVILVIDMENDFVMPGSPMRVEGAYATLPAIKKFLVDSWLLFPHC